MEPRDQAWQIIIAKVVKLEEETHDRNLQQILNELPHRPTRYEYLSFGETLIHGMAELADKMGYIDEARRTELVIRLDLVHEALSE